MSQMPPNPYQAQVPASGPMPPVKMKPTAIMVFGILNIIFSLLGLCGLVATVAAFFLPVQPGAELPANQLMQNDAWRLFAMVMIPLGFIATVALLASGVALLQDKGWGRTVAVWYSIYALVSGIIGVFINFFLIALPTMQMMGDLPNGPQKSGAIGGAIGGTFGGCIGMIYPALLLYFMTRLNVKAYFEARDQN